jgi:hypothetical protein
MELQDILAYYARPAAMTAGGKYAQVLASLPEDVGSLVRIVQGLVIHEFVAAPFYGVTLDEERSSESHIRTVEAMLDRIVALDERPLWLARAPERRLAGVCRHYMVLLLAMLRVKGIPARGRCGFGAYFNPPFFEDHVVCEYWNGAANRWMLADAQFDEVWRERSGIRHDILDVPRDQFLIAADAWARCRAGEADPEKFGIVKGNLRGLWFVAVNLIHDAATLNKVEPLRWDVWGGMPRPGAPLGDRDTGFFDEIATLTRHPDEAFERLRDRYESDGRLCVPDTVFNALRQRPEPIGFGGETT